MVEIEWIRPIAKGLWGAQFITMDYLPDKDKPIINIPKDMHTYGKNFFILPKNTVINKLIGAKYFVATDSFPIASVVNNIFKLLLITISINRFNTFE
jgi:hypothetical protein